MALISMLSRGPVPLVPASAAAGSAQPSVARGGGSSRGRSCHQGGHELPRALSALNICVAQVVGVPFDRALPVASETVAQVLKGKHGSRIQSLGPKALTIKGLRSGSATSAVIGAVQTFPKLIPADVVANVQKLLKSKPPGGIPALAAPAGPK